MATPRLCSIPECGKPAKCRGWCNMHHMRWFVHGDPLKGAHKPAGLCSIQGCGKPHVARGWCDAHYTRWRRNGDPLGGGTSHGELQRFLEVVVLAYDGGDCFIWPYARGANGYAQATVDGKKDYVHRLVCEHVDGFPPSPEHQAAHSCGRGHLGCVSPKHLSWKTASGNQMDKVAHGTHNRGERQGSSKLTESDVLEIRSLKGKLSKHDAAKIYGVSANYIATIQARKAWQWLD